MSNAHHLTTDEIATGSKVKGHKTTLWRACSRSVVRWHGIRGLLQKNEFDTMARGSRDWSAANCTWLCIVRGSAMRLNGTSTAHFSA